jgi:hypothetical protein
VADPDYPASPDNLFPKHWIILFGLWRHLVGHGRRLMLTASNPKP